VSELDADIMQAKQAGSFLPAVRRRREDPLFSVSHPFVGGTKRDNAKKEIEQRTEQHRVPTRDKNGKQ
jgi:hypothetical protein